MHILVFCFFVFLKRHLSFELSEYENFIGNSQIVFAIKQWPQKFYHQKLATTKSLKTALQCTFKNQIWASGRFFRLACPTGGSRRGARERYHLTLKSPFPGLKGLLIACILRLAFLPADSNSQLADQQFDALPIEPPGKGIFKRYLTCF